MPISCYYAPPLATQFLPCLRKKTCKWSPCLSPADPSPNKMQHMEVRKWHTDVCLHRQEPLLLIPGWLSCLFDPSGWIHCRSAQDLLGELALKPFITLCSANWLAVIGLGCRDNWWSSQNGDSALGFSLSFPGATQGAYPVNTSTPYIQ